VRVLFSILFVFCTFCSAISQESAAQKTNADSGGVSIRDVLSPEEMQVSDQEIARIKSNENFWLYTLSGGALSLGTSFLISSLVAKANTDDIDSPITFIGTGAGAVVGTFLFARAGLSKDQEQARKEILFRRAEVKLKQDLETKSKREIESEIEQLKMDRDLQEKELEKLRDRVQKKGDSSE